jgi:hypothetical protein
MANLSEMIASGAVCCCLRTKTMFFETDDQPSATSYGPFWCAQTQSVLGPDGNVAEPEKCQPGRSCCEKV